jgi:hypothetical protein
LWPCRDRELEGETRGTQFRQIRAAKCVIPYVLYVAQLWIDWGCLQDDAYREIGVPASPYIVREAGLQVGLRERVLVVHS